MRLHALILLATLPLAAGAEREPVLVEPHLAVVPRTAEEAARVAAITAPPESFAAPEPFEANPGGAGTVRARATASAFSQPQANLSFEDELTFQVGDGLFRKLWVSAPASTKASDGLGPVFNARSCQSCHLKDGRGHPPEGRGAVSLVVRAGIPGFHGARPAGAPDADHGAAEPGPDPVYGRQIGDLSLPGIPAEAQVAVAWREEPVTLGDGEVVALRRPEWRLEGLGYGPLDPGTEISPRVAPQMIGLGLVEAIPAADILALADPEDADGDGVSGRAAMVRSPEWDAPMLGRFGVRATTATLRQQAADAFANDIGIASPLRPEPWGECTEAQAACREAPDGRSAVHDDAEIDAEGLDLVTFYAPHPRRARPARRGRRTGAARQGAVPRGGLRGLPHTEVRHPPPGGPTGALVPIDLAPLRLPPARHGAGPRRRTARRRGHGLRMAHGAAVGHGPDRAGVGPLGVPARRPRALAHGGHPVARWRGPARARRLRRPAAGRPRRPDPVPGEPVTRLILVLTILASPTLADVEEVVVEHILPGQAAFAEAAEGLARAAREDCSADALRGPWDAAYDAWLAVAHLRFGPAEEEGRAQAVAFWPDERDATGRALEGLLAQDDPAALEPAAFARQSVAARGLLALERLLTEIPYGEGDRACGLARAIAADLAATADALRAGWDDQARALRTAGEPGNALYLSEDEARATLYTALATGLEFVADGRLGRPLGTFDRPRPLRAEARRSGRSARNVALSLAALRDLAAALAPAPLTLAALDRAIGSAEALDDPAFAGVAEPASRIRIEALRTEVAEAREVAAVEIGEALELTAGFNALDGD